MNEPAAARKPASSRGLQGKIILGLLTILPLAVVWFVLSFLIDFLSWLGRPLIDALFDYSGLKNRDTSGWLSNEVVLTALAVLHWNEKRLPQQRAELYESVLMWLSRSRKQRPGRPGPEQCINLLQELARAMQEHPAGRQVQAPREWAARILAPRFRDIDSAQEQLERAAAFLEEEELDSGIVVRRGSDVRFWHLTFQEHLAARALAGEEDAERRRVLFVEDRAWQPEWREVVLLLAGLLHQQKPERVDALVSAALDSVRGGRSVSKRLRWWWTGGVPLADHVRCVSLLGAVLFDLEPLKYAPNDPRFDEALRSVAGGAVDPDAGARGRHGRTGLGRPACRVDLDRSRL